MVDAARRAGRVWDEEGDWVRRGLDERGDLGSPAPSSGSNQSSAHSGLVTETAISSTSRWGGQSDPHNVSSSQTFAQRHVSVERSESAMSGRRESSPFRDSSAMSSIENHRTSDTRLENGQRRASFQQSFMSPPPGGYASPTSSSKSAPGWTPYCRRQGFWSKLSQSS